MSNLRNDNTDSKCGKGWERGPGGKCVRSKKKRTIRQVIGGAASKVFPYKDVDKSYKWNEKKTKKMAAAAGIALAGGGALALAGRYRNQGAQQPSGGDGWDDLVKSSAEQKERISQMNSPQEVSSPPGKNEGRSRPESESERERRTKKVSPSRSKKLRRVVMRRKGRRVDSSLDYANQNFKYDSADVDTLPKSQRTDAMKKARCKKGIPCGAICISKGETCNQGKYGDKTAKYNQEFMGAAFAGLGRPDGTSDIAAFRKLPKSTRSQALRQAYEFNEQMNWDSMETDINPIKQEIEAAHGFHVDDIYRVQTRSDGALVGIGVSGGDFFEFDITKRSVGVVERSDLTFSANEQARGVLSASGIDYRGDSAFEYLRGREVRLDAPMQSNGQCGKGWKPGPGGKCVRGKGMGMAGKIGLGIAGAAALGGAAYAGRKQLSEAYLNVRSGAAGSQAKYEARKAATMAKRAAGKDARRAVKQGVAAAQGAANQAGREVRKATVMAKRAAGKTVRQAGNVLGRGISEGTAKKVDQAKYQARKAMVQAKRAAGKDARRSAKQGIAAAQGTVAKVDRTAFATAGRVAGKDARQRVTGNVRQAISRDVREINREVGRQKMAGRK